VEIQSCGRPLAKQNAGPIHLVIDSTGLKIMGDGEWHSHKHTTSNTRRAWRKLHLGVDQDGFIVASELTESSVDDASVGAVIIEEPGGAITRFTADERAQRPSDLQGGAYDTRAIYEALEATSNHAPTVVIPPRRTASTSEPPDPLFDQRDAAIARIEEVGRRPWRTEAGAHRQARAENAMFRYKRLIGDALRSRKTAAQKREAMIAVNVINTMTALGMPDSVAVAT
jgi:hypothetical protein